MSDDLSILISTREIEINGEPLTVREYTLSDSLHLYSDIQTLVQGLADVLKVDDLNVEAVYPVLAKAEETLNRLMAASVNKSDKWVASLPAVDGAVLMDWWWVLNRDFFISAATRCVMLRDRKVRKPSG
ncbi:DUF6631 family protein [Serratia fonticola]|uniref:Uncharacterized protein n=1 Tax=Serratia fonticola TaxID=47917 RepID=A0AAW3WUC8_SERFO|nr:DUF6631 family protein [Serratia fonticola]MBC3214865.1 hypothetical protein [Serratia fonticola]NYA15434.1 hypothetical protein [Serratia fonticola]NYA35541.1 hypothetical protein [Serratia fonticola]